MGAGTVLVTGASGGIGCELARVFAARGHDLILVARNRQKLKSLAAELSQDYGVRAEAFPRDLGRSDAAQALFAALERRRVAVDVLVNNAAVLGEGPFADAALTEHLSLLQLNLLVPTALTHLFLGPMLDRGAGRILNVASIAAFQALPRLAVYAAAKAYVLHFTEALSEELVGTGVTVTALCPGFTDTQMMTGTAVSSWVPAFAVSTPEAVARDGYEACMRGVPVHVSGATNQWVTQLTRYQPRWWVRALAGMVARRQR
jgi:short-subunit dehydrogenase